MALAPLSDPIAAAVADLFHQDRWQPSHDDLTVQFKRVGLSQADPRASFAMTGKRKRVKRVLLHALDQDMEAGRQLVANLVGLVKGAGGFRSTSEFYVGAETYANVKEAFRADGFNLDTDGNLRPTMLENLEGADLDAALLAYVRRAQQGATDAALVTGTGKDLLEAAARRVIESAGENYAGKDFPGTLFNAFYLRGMEPSGSALEMLKQRHSDARQGLVDALYVAGCAVNALRNQQGTGHGRPFPPTVTDREARTAIEMMGVISEMLLKPAV